LGFWFFDGWEDGDSTHTKFSCIEGKEMGLLHASLHGYRAKKELKFGCCEMSSSPLFSSLLACEMSVRSGWIFSFVAWQLRELIIVIRCHSFTLNKC